jgi:hypothetical protein
MRIRVTSASCAYRSTVDGEHPWARAIIAATMNLPTAIVSVAELVAGAFSMMIERL